MSDLTAEDEQSQLQEVLAGVSSAWKIPGRSLDFTFFFFLRFSFFILEREKTGKGEWQAENKREKQTTH